jgi:soluble lytic murein transglycosylase-like protein
MLMVAFFFVLLFPGSGLGVGPDIFLTASKDSGVPAELLLAVSHVESSFNPHALNLAGRSVFPSSRDEAESVLSRSGDNVDIGLMQVNYAIWGKKFGLSKLDLLDPGLNVQVGAKILGHYVKQSRGW